MFNLTSKLYELLIESSNGNRSLDIFQAQLNEKMEGQRLLLVLDDFWAESFLDWNLFEMAFSNVAHASVILVTTCNEDVEITMHTAITFFFLPIHTK